MIILPGAKICTAIVTGEWNQPACLDAFETTVELDNVTLALPVEVIEKFLRYMFLKYTQKH